MAVTHKSGFGEEGVGREGGTEGGSEAAAAAAGREGGGVEMV